MLPCWADVAISIRCLRSLTLVCYTNRHLMGVEKGHISRYCELEKSAGTLSEFEIHLKCMELMKASEKSLLELTATRAKAQGGEHHL